MWVDKSDKWIGKYITYILDKTRMIWKTYVSISAGCNLACLIDHASFINFDTSIWQCFITKINLSDNDNVWKCTCFKSTSSNKILRLLLHTEQSHRKWYSFSMAFNWHSLHALYLWHTFMCVHCDNNSKSREEGKALVSSPPQICLLNNYIILYDNMISHRLEKSLFEKMEFKYLFVTVVNVTLNCELIMHSIILYYIVPLSYSSPIYMYVKL